ncbi:MAG: CARDB domain-containing protein, partial [Candidatus Thermoplasmatota archaeon]
TEAGEYVVTATYEGEPSISTTVTVEEGPYFEVKITDHDDNVTVGDNVTIEYTITNTGNTEATQTIVFEVGDEKIDTKEVTLKAGDVHDGEFKWDTGEEDPGEHEVRVKSDNDEDTVMVNVEEEEEDAGGFLAIPGFTTMILLLAVVIAVALYHKNR